MDNQVRAARLQAGMVMQQLAVAAKTSPAQLVIIEKYGHVPQADLRRRIAEALGTSEAELWPGVGGAVQDDSAK